MAKASLTKVTKEWIEGKKSKNNNLKKQRKKKIKNVKHKNIQKEKYKELTGRSVTTFHISNEVRRLLMYHKADTGETMSEVIERLILKNLGRK